VSTFAVEDEFHCDMIAGPFATYEEALQAIEALAVSPFDQAPNRPPCIGWKNCHRDYCIVESDSSQHEVARTYVLSLFAEKQVWHQRDRHPD
jgi:hypothetical protein